MRTVLLLMALGLAGTSCKGDAPRPAPSAADRVREISIDELASRIASGACTPVDANGDSLRKKVGVIPGAVLLTDYETYAAAELPADKAKPLAFYCANEQCGAAQTAAEKAVLAGYSDVRVLPVGVLGWQKSGKTLQTL